MPRIDIRTHLLANIWNEAEVMFLNRKSSVKLINWSAACKSVTKYPLHINTVESATRYFILQCVDRHYSRPPCRRENRHRRAIASLWDNGLVQVITVWIGQDYLLSITRTKSRLIYCLCQRVQRRPVNVNLACSCQMPSSCRGNG